VTLSCSAEEDGISAGSSRPVLGFDASNAVRAAVLRATFSRYTLFEAKPNLKV
jgi:hypothetical protein